MPPQPKPAADPLTDLLRLWLAAFAGEAVSVRHVLDRAIDASPELLDGLNAAVPGFALHPHPPTLMRWLTGIENLPILLDGSRRYRFSRCGHRWAVLTFGAPEVV